MNENLLKPNKTYYRNSRFVNFVLAGFAVLIAVLRLIPLLSLSPSMGATIRIVLIVILLLGGAIFLIYSAQHIRLITSSNGVEYYQVGYSVCTTWDNIERIGKIRAGRVLAEGFILRESAICVNGWLARFNWFKQRGRMIPLSLFTKEWRNTELGQDIREFAPNLLVEGNNQ